MSSPIDLTVSDDEILSPRPRSQGKRKVLIDLDGVDDTPTKRSQCTPGGSRLPSSSGSRRDSVLNSSTEEHTPTKRTILPSERGARHSSQHTSRRGEANVTASHHTLAGLNPPPLSFASPPSPPAAIGDDSDDEVDEVDEAFELEETTRLEYEQALHHRDAKRIPEGHKLVNSAKVQGVSLKPGMSIELQDGDFLRIVYIFREKGGDDMSAYLLRGILLRRNAKMDNKFPKVLNELVAMISIPKDDNRPHLIAGLQDRPLTEYARTREVRFSNARCKEFSFREDESQEFYYYDLENNSVKCNEGLAFEKAPLVCRFKLVEKWQPSLKPFSEACLRLEPNEADIPYRRNNVFLLHQYLREMRGRADERASEDTAIQGGFADLYCGSGGASEAARLAGIPVAIAVDNKECAVRSHQHNHPECLTIHSDVYHFITSPGEKGYFNCDLCHTSCPCRFWSPLHTVAGKDDEENEAASFMVGPAIHKLGCRIMSFEQTPGFSRMKKHRPQWNAFIHQFTSLGFSVEWKIISFAETGGPNKRSRLWIFATCPGQQMPEEIKATHGPPGSGLLPYMTVRQAISDIPAGATMHDPEEQANRFRRAGGRSTLPTAEWDKPLQHLIPTAGPRALHPSGTRRFTIRETLCLQGFGTQYHYIGDEHGQPPSRTESMKMAGDAVPPKPATPYFASAKEALRITDEELAACENRVIE